MKTDVILSKRKQSYDQMTMITGSRDVVYLDKSLKDDVRNLAHLINKLMPHFRELLNLPENLTIRLTKTKKRNNNGKWSNHENTATIDCRTSARNRKFSDILDTLAHELVHAEQYHTGKLEDTRDHSGKYGSSWMGSFVKSKGATYNTYVNLPWEKEAFSRSGELFMEALVCAFRAGTLTEKAVINNVGWVWLRKNHSDIAANVS